jgi:hypothetical protein
MTGMTLRAAALAVAALPWAASNAWAQGYAPQFQSAARMNAAPAASASNAVYNYNTQAQAANASAQNGARPYPGQPMTIGGQRPGTTQSVVGAYPYLNAPMYTSPVQNVPYQVGGTFYTNQAFAPHEMLYEHQYKAMYPPYYYKVNGHWMVLPWGVWSAEDWELLGTKVQVTYKARHPIYSLFAAPWH